MTITEIVFHEYSKIISSKDGRYKKLLSYADKYLRRYNINGRAITPDDVINEAITKIAFGERTWDIKSEPDLYSFLFMVIRSCISHFSLNERRIIKPGENKEEQEKCELDFQNYVDTHCLEYNKGNDRLYEDKNACYCCLSKFEDDDECMLVIFNLYEGMMRKEIAADLGLSIRNVNTIIEKIRHRSKAIVRDYKGLKKNN